MRKGLILLVLLLAVVGMSLGVATAGCGAGTVGAEVFAAAGGDPSGGAATDALLQVDAAIDPVEAEAGDIPIC